jgi:hypothetical protein
MRKLFALLSVATVITLASCGGSKHEEAAATDSMAVDSTTVVPMADSTAAPAADSTAHADSTVKATEAK